MKSTLILALPEADNLPSAIVSSISLFDGASVIYMCTSEFNGEKENNSGLASLAILIYIEVKICVLIGMIPATKWGSIVV